MNSSNTPLGISKESECMSFGVAANEDHYTMKGVKCNRVHKIKTSSCRHLSEFIKFLMPSLFAVVIKAIPGNSTNNF